MAFKWSLFLFLSTTILFMIIIVNQHSVFGQSTTTTKTTTTISIINQQPQSLDKLSSNSYTLSSMDDVEMLTYFLLYRYGYFNHTSDHHHHHHGKDDNQNDEDILTESKLREFIEKIKINQLVPNKRYEQSSSSSTLTSAAIDPKTKMCSKFMLENLLKSKRWGPSNGSSINSNNGVSLINSKINLICEAANSCKNAKNLVDLVGLNSIRTPTLSQSIARLCPLMLFQMQEKECVDQQESQFKAKNKPTMSSVWGFGLLFVTIVSFCSIAGVGILPFLNEYSYQIMITILEGLAVGSLVGSALFHLIPQAFNLMIPGNHEYLWRALIIFGGIYMFFWSERLMKIVSEFRRRKKSKDFSLPSTTSLENDPQKLRQVHYNNQIHCDDQQQCGGDEQQNHHHQKSMVTIVNNHHPHHYNHHHGSNNHIHDNNDDDDGCRDRTNSKMLSMKHDHNIANHHHSHLHPIGGNETDEIATIAWMIIFGDGLHNFIDGVTMGAAFSQSILEGISISVAVICEEFPHELGDFAILLGSGMSMRKALGYNFLSACTCYLGFAFGILIGDLSDATPYVFALAAGMFLYISLVDMMGELSNKLEQAGKRGLSHTLQMLLLQNLGIIIGVSIMFILAKYSDRINFEGLVPPKNSDIPFTES
uniref:Zinc transporter ZIP14-like n=1 Tax=Dermatophagoides pteronyssinus TaxID=6956 RepID=A0A6P6Y3E2_DERPT|nr:zinc transporter ZIP14-like [Dermatophagoides pteronyssinus]